MVSRKHKNILLVGLSLSVIVLAIILVTTRKSGTLHADLKSFAVEDTASITKIFLANTVGNQTLLERKNNSWIVNNKYEPLMSNIADLLNCIQNIEVKAPVAKSARENINKRMASGSTKVEIYYTDYRIKIGNLRLWKDTCKKAYYIGQPTMDNIGSFAIMEGSKYPCVIYLPGFRGFVTPKYSPIEDDWRSHLIVDLKLSQIQEIISTDFENIENSFRIVRSGNRHFDIIHAATNQKLAPYDTMKLLDHLSDYRNLNYEVINSTLSKVERDSLFERKFKEISVTDTKGNRTTITMYHLENEYDTLNYEYPENSIDFMEAYNRDRFFATINNNKNEVYFCQYFVFDRIVQPFAYYLINSRLTATPKTLK